VPVLVYVLFISCNNVVGAVVYLKAIALCCSSILTHGYARRAKQRLPVLIKYLAAMRGVLKQRLSVLSKIPGVVQHVDAVVGGLVEVLDR